MFLGAPVVLRNLPTIASARTCRPRNSSNGASASLLTELKAESSNRKSSARVAALLDAGRARPRLLGARRRLFQGSGRGFAGDRRTKLFISGRREMKDHRDILAESGPANCALIQSTGISLTMMAYRCGPQSRPPLGPLSRTAPPSMMRCPPISAVPFEPKGSIRPAARRNAQRSHSLLHSLLYLDSTKTREAVG